MFETGRGVPQNYTKGATWYRRAAEQATASRNIRSGCSGATISILPANLPATTSSLLDILSNDRAGDAGDSVDIGRVTPIARPNRCRTARPLPGGNPLWSIPLSALPATQERPIFSASHRPPQRAVVAPAEQAAAPLPPAAEPDRPALALIGAVVGDSDAIAIFLDRVNQKIVRLRQGEAHCSWVLSSVQGREVTLKKAERSEVLVLQRQESPAAGLATPALPGPVIPAASNSTTSVAPFTPFDAEEWRVGRSLESPPPRADRAASAAYSFRMAPNTSQTRCC